MKVLIADLETDGLLPDLTRLWMIQLGDADGTDVVVYADQPGFPPISAALSRLEAADHYVFHNGLSFDMPALNRFYPGAIVREKLLDTLVMARLAEPEHRNHSLKSWGERLGVAKGPYKGDFQSFTPELVIYAEQDIVVGRGLYHKVKHVLDWGHSSQLEHDVAYWITLQERNGWEFDVKGAQELEVALRDELSLLNAELQETFPPLLRKVEFTPKRSNRTKGWEAGVPVDRSFMQPFAISNRRHVAERLQMLGWKPSKFGEDGTPTVDEKTLAALPYHQVRTLLRSFRLQKQLGMLSDGKSGWLKLVAPNGRLYHRVNTNGAVTGRMSHSGPNIAQADKKDIRMRRLFRARPRWTMMGCDADGLEARMLGHYLARYDNGAFSDRVVNGEKAKGSDVHTANLRALHKAQLLVVPKSNDPAALIKAGREGAKTCLYALMYGAGDWKLGETVKGAARDTDLRAARLPSKELGILVRKALATSMVGIDKLVADIGHAVKTKGYLLGLDGRHMPVRSPHSALNTLLQGGGAVVMKQALALFGERLEAQGYEDQRDYGLCGNIHDEVQIEVRDTDLAHEFGRQFATCITEAGARLNLRCELAGSYSIGPTWADTH